LLRDGALDKNAAVSAVRRIVQLMGKLE